MRGERMVAEMKDFFDLVRSRESCRNFSERPVEREKLVRCAEAARLAPSACDSQPWEFVAVTGGPLLEGVSACARALGGNAFTKKCGTFVAVVEKTAILNGAAGSAPDQKYAKFDMGLSTMLFCLAATEQGLSTCIMGAVDKEGIDRLLQVKGGDRVFVLIAVGYAADDSLRKKLRKAPDEVLRFAE